MTGFGRHALLWRRAAIDAHQASNAAARFFLSCLAMDKMSRLLLALLCMATSCVTVAAQEPRETGSKEKLIRALTASADEVAFYAASGDACGFVAAADAARSTFVAGLQYMTMLTDAERAELEAKASEKRPYLCPEASRAIIDAKLAEVVRMNGFLNVEAGLQKLPPPPREEIFALETRAVSLAHDYGFAKYCGLSDVTYRLQVSFYTFATVSGFGQDFAFRPVGQLGSEPTTDGACDPEVVARVSKHLADEAAQLDRASNEKLSAILWPH